MDLVNNFLRQFAESVVRHPDKEAIVDRDGLRTTTYDQLDKENFIETLADF